MTGYIRTRWYKLKKEAESRFAPSIGRRVELFMTGYHNLHNEVGRWAVKIDGEEIFGIGDCQSWKYKYNENGSPLSANMRETLTPPEFNVEEGGERT